MKSISTFLFLFLLYTAQAQHNPMWVRFADPANYQNFDVTEVSVKTDTFKDVYTAASVLDTANNREKVMLVKYDSSGNKLWEQIYDANNVDYNGSYAVTLLVDINGNSYVGGYGRNNHGDYDFMLLKYNAAGSQQWVEYWDGGQSGRDYPTSATFDAQGNIILAGYDNNNTGTYPNGDDAAVVKWAPDGTLLWSYSWNDTIGNDEDRALAVSTDLNSNIFITGSTYINGIGREVFVTKLDSSGNAKWTNIYTYTNDNGDNHGYAIVTDNAGNSYVTGQVHESAGEGLLLKYNSTGTLLWNKQYAGFSSTVVGKKIFLDAAGNVTIAGDEFVSTSNQTDYVVFKYDNNGNFLWAYNYNSDTYESSETLYDAIADAAGNVYLTGTYDGPSNTDFKTIIVSPAGNLLWQTPYSNQLDTIGQDRAYAITLDRSNNIIVAGISQTTEALTQSNLNVSTVKYAAPELATGIHDVAADNIQLSVYPNPGTGNIHIVTNSESLLGTEITVTNLIGENVIAPAKMNTLHEQIDLSGVAKGMYIITVKNGTAPVSKKLLVE